MKIAIIGGAGFIGSHLATAYLDAGHDVLVIDTLIHGSLDAVDARARFYQVDMRDSKLQSILQRERPDIVSHHAAHRSQDSQALVELALVDADVHVRGLLNVLDSCVAASVSKIIFASNGNSLYGQIGQSGQSGHMGSFVAEEQGQVKTFVAHEDTPLSPLKPFDITKVAGEGYVRYYTRKYGLSHTILRYADVYGETDKEPAQHPLTYFIRMLLEHRRPVMRGAGDAKLDHIFIDDVVQANLRALGRGHNQTLHISSGEGHSLDELFAAVASYVQSELKPLSISQSLEGASCILDNSQAARVLGWSPAVDFSHGVQWAVDRFKAPVEVQRMAASVTQSAYIDERYLVGAR